MNEENRPEGEGAPPLSDELRGLDPAAGASPGGDGPGPAAPGRVTDAEREAAMAVSSLIVGALVNGLMMRWPALVYTPDEKTAAAAVLAPVLIKHGITPAWLEAWREEMAAAATLGGLAYVGYQRVLAAGGAGSASGAEAGTPGAPRDITPRA